jgi:hypothetical protein
LALNDAVDAYDEAYAVEGALLNRVVALALRLDLVTAALAATLAVLPAAARRPLEDLLGLTAPAAAWAASVARGGAAGPSADLEQRLRRLHEASPVVSVLPTVDPRPLDVVETDNGRRNTA